VSRRGRLAAVAALLLTPSVALAQASPSPFTSGTRYDTVGRVTGTISADPDTVGSGNPFLAVRNTYDAAGRLTQVETGFLTTWQSEAVAPANWSGFTVEMILVTSYDAMGRKLRDVMSTGGTVRRVTQFSYDAAGRLECTAARMNPVIFPNAAGSGGSLPASACTAGSQGGGANAFGPDRIARTSYDMADQRLQLREGVGTADEGTEATWAYNLNGQVTTVIDGNGNRATLVYDGFGRQNCWMFPSTTRPASFDDTSHATALATAGVIGGGFTNGHCTSGDYESYEYDPNGNRTNLRKRDWRNIVYAYDALNRVVSKSYPQGGATPVHYGYDLRNLQLYARYTSAGGQGVNNSYDGFGRLSSQSIDLGGTTHAISHLYDRNGNRTRVTHPDGIAFNYLYDGLNRSTWIQDTNYAVQYGYRSFGTLSGIGRVGGSTGVNITADARLTSLTHYVGAPQEVQWTFGHNPAAQITMQTRTNDAYAWTGSTAAQRVYQTNGLNQYGQTIDAGSTTTFVYDASGSLASETNGGVTKSYIYDIENRLVIGNGVTLAYDPLGRLYEVTQGGNTTRFLFDGDALVAEYNGGGALVRRYVHGVGADLPVMQYEGATVGAATRRYLLADNQGSIVALTDGGSAIQSRNSYDEFGVPAATNTGRFQYTGQIWINEIGMYYYKARIYTPRLGRFMQADPIGYQGGVNLYAYSSNDPLNRSDPTGQADIEWFTQYDPASFRATQELFNLPNIYTVFSHGSSRGTFGIRTGSAPYNYASYTAQTMGLIIRSKMLAEGTAGRPIVLFACFVGRSNAPEIISRLNGDVAVVAATDYTTRDVLVDGSIGWKLTGTGEFRVTGGRGWADLGITLPRNGHVVGLYTHPITGRRTARIDVSETGYATRIRRTEYREMQDADASQ